MIGANPPAVFYETDTGAIHQRAPKTVKEQATKKNSSDRKSKKGASTAQSPSGLLSHVSSKKDGSYYTHA